MYLRVTYKMTEKERDIILDASKPTAVMKIGSCVSHGPQINANRAWEALGKKMGFDFMTVRPISGKDMRFFTAVPSETIPQREARLAREAVKARLSKIAKLKTAIATQQTELEKLEKEKNP